MSAEDTSVRRNCSPVESLKAKKKVLFDFFSREKKYNGVLKGTCSKNIVKEVEKAS